MIGVEHIEDWRGQTVLDRAGESLGKLEDVYLDRDSGQPLLAVVKSGLLGRHSTLVPIDGATVGRDHLRVAHDRATIEGAPDIASDDPPDAETLASLGTAYGLRFSDRVTLERSADAEARRAEAQAARERADALARDAEAKAAARDAAHERAQGAHDQASEADRDADEARRAAAQADEEAQRYGRP